MIIITGASDGLGLKILASARREGFETVNIARRDNVHATRNITTDLASIDDIKRAAAEIMKINEPTALVLNAGVLSLTKIANVDVNEYERVMNINLRAPVMLIAELYDWIVKTSVDIIIINSVAGLRGSSGQMVYDISKWGLRGLTEDLRVEFANTHVRVVAVYPGMLDTEMASKLPTGAMPKSKKPTIDTGALANMIISAIMQPKSMQISDLIVDRKA